jgi:5-phospho-D-xylono-1,4-lactonase
VNLIKIRTVKGDIEKKNLGWCHCHDHIFLADGPSAQINSALRLDDYKKSESEVFLFKKAGGNSFIDCQPGFFGRMAKSLVRVSKKTKINIVAVTGFHKLEFLEDKTLFENAAIDKLSQHFIDEIEKGMFEKEERLNNKAGVIKCAQAAGLDWKCKAYLKLFDAVANCAKETIAPVIVHLDTDADAIGLVEFFINKGIEPKKLILCHLDRAKYDFGYHEEVASTGAYLEYDTINRLKYHSNKKEIELIDHMIEAGYKNNILLGMDTTNKRLKSYGADFGQDYILTDFKYQMMKQGIDEKTINIIMKDNAAEALAF